MCIRDRKNTVSQAAVVVGSMFPGHQNGYQTGRDDDCQYHLLQCIGGAPGAIIRQGSLTVLQQWLQTLTAQLYADGIKMCIRDRCC